MKRDWLFIAGVALALAVQLAGCHRFEVVSVESVIPESEAIFDPELVGVWVSEQGGAAFLAPDSRGDKAYLFCPLEKCGKARLGRLGEHLVLEISDPESLDAELLLPIHRLVVLEKIGPDEVHTWELDSEAFQAALHAGEVGLAHRIRDDYVILYDSASSIRTELASYLGRAGALTEPWIWNRERMTFLEELTHSRQIEREDVPCFEASPWPEADALFRRDPRREIGSVESSLELTEGKVLWLLNLPRIRTSGEQRYVANAVAVQSGTDPSAASIEFYLAADEDGAPQALISGAADESYYFIDGVRIADRLLLLTRWHGDDFRSGWDLMMVDNLDDEPPSWRIKSLEVPDEAREAVGEPAALLVLGEHVYLLWSVETRFNSYWVHALRWPRHSVLAGDLGTPEWIRGEYEDQSWVPGMPPADRLALFESDTKEFTVHVDPASGWLLAVQMTRDSPRNVVLRGSRLLGLDWSEPRIIYRPAGPDYYSDAKAHPALTGADLVLTYDSSRGPTRFLRLARCDEGVEP
jgi:hypothetical protein